MRPIACALLLLLAAAPVSAQKNAAQKTVSQNSAASAKAADALAPLAFLEGDWDAKTASTHGVAAAGSYTFRRELAGHILARHSRSSAGCKGPATFDCEHGDLLYVYEDAPGQPVRAIYFDNEGHVIHYTVSTPSPTQAVFLSEPSGPGPQFRLTYELKGSVMSGKFQVQMPGQQEWRSYLEWSGAKK